MEIPVVKCQLVREDDGLEISPTTEDMGNDVNAAAILRKYLAGADREHFVALLMDTKKHLIAVNTVSIGTLNFSFVHPREVFKPAILASAAGIILGHNHPSGDPSPSQEDIALTKRLVQAGELLGIQVLDHIIIGLGNSFFGFKREGYIS